jgi:hypothetical protein
MSTAKQLAKEVRKAKGNALDLQIGNRVIHTLTGILGRVEEVCTYGDQTLVSVRTDKGRLLSKLARQEFQLASR